MLWLADECVDARIVAALRVDGQDVLHAVEAARGVSDVEILNRRQGLWRSSYPENRSGSWIGVAAGSYRYPVPQAFAIAECRNAVP